MILPFRIAKCGPVPMVTEVRAKASGEIAAVSPSEFFARGFFQPIGQNGLRASVASKLDLWVSSIAGRFELASVAGGFESAPCAAAARRLVRQRTQKSGFIF